jgi:glycosyltransferase involved in cell wall biosynthesis
MKWFVKNKFETLVPSIMRYYELIKDVHASNLKNSEKEELVEEILRWHHVDPHKRTKRQVCNLVFHGTEILNSNEKSYEEKRSAAEEYLRIAQISRIFRPEMGAQIDQLCGLCHKIKRVDLTSIPEAAYPVKPLNPLVDTNVNWRKDDNPTIRAKRWVQSGDCPLVSIGMTVYNQAPFLEKTIESLLAQEYQNFELIIADNASDDDSGRICERYAKKDTRIRLLKNEYNIGKIGNFDLVLNTSGGQFFLWSTGHDLYHPKFLSLLVDEFKANDDSVSLCYPGIAFIDQKDNLIQQDNDYHLDTRGMGPAERYKNIIWKSVLENSFNGLYRASVIRKIWEPYTVRGPMHVIIANIALNGTTVQLQDTLFYKRINVAKAKYCMGQEGPFLNSLSIRKYETGIPYTMLAYEHIEMVRRCNLNEASKSELYSETKKCFCKKYKLKEEALLFLTEGAEKIKNNKNKSTIPYETVEQLTQLADICSFFNSEYKYAFEKFKGVINHIVQTNE